MASDSSAGASGAITISASKRSEILQELAGIASTVANAQIDGLITRLADALLRASAGASAKEAKLCFDAAALLKKNRYPFYYVASERIATMLRHEILLLEYPAAPESDEGEAPPSLSAEVEIDKTLCLIKASRAIENEHIERLAALSARLGELLGRNALITAENPFRPHVFLSAIHDAWCEFQPATGSHHVIYPLLGPELCIDMGSVLHALNTALAKRGILPHLPQAGERPEEANAAVPEASDDEALTQQLRRLFPEEEKKPVDRPLAGAFPSLFDEDTLQSAATHKALLSFLARVEQKLSGHAPSMLLEKLRTDVPRELLAGSDGSVIQMVAKIFDLIRTDVHIADELKKLLAALQLPLLRAALADSEFFFKRVHPPRRALELLIRLCVAWDKNKGTTDPLYQLIARSVESIRQESEQRAGVFADVVGQLQAWLTREETAAGDALSGSIAQALQQEKLLVATRAAKHEVALRVGTGEVVAFVETFLEDKWVAVLTLAYGIKEETPQAADHAIKTMDDLVWSVKPKITMDERKELLAKLPSMVAALNKWLDLIKWNDDARLKFFDDLAKCHASIVRAPLDLSPERQLQIAMAVAKQAAERREQRQAKFKPEPPADSFDELVRRLELGTWVAFGTAEASRKLRLAWVSPMRNLYMFATPGRKEALSLSAEELAQALRENRAQLVLGAGLIGRALADALAGGHADNDAALARAS